MHYAIIRRMSQGNVHPSKTKSILVLRGPIHLLQGAKSLWSSVGFDRNAISKGHAVSHRTGIWALIYSDMWVPKWHWHYWQLSNCFWGCRFQQVKNAVLRQLQGFSFCAGFLWLYHSVFFTLWKFWLLACTLYAYPQQHFLGQLSFLTLTCTEIEVS